MWGNVGRDVGEDTRVEGCVKKCGRVYGVSGGEDGGVKRNVRKVLESVWGECGRCGKSERSWGVCEKVNGDVVQWCKVTKYFYLSRLLE